MRLSASNQGGSSEHTPAARTTVSDHQTRRVATLAAPSAPKARTQTLGPVLRQRNRSGLSLSHGRVHAVGPTRKGGSDVHRWRRSCGDHHHHLADLAALTGARCTCGGNGSDDDRDSDDDRPCTPEHHAANAIPRTGRRKGATGVAPSRRTSTPRLRPSGLPASARCRAASARSLCPSPLSRRQPGQGSQPVSRRRLQLEAAEPAGSPSTGAHSRDPLRR